MAEISQEDEDFLTFYLVAERVLNQNTVPGGRKYTDALAGGRALQRSGLFRPQQFTDQSQVTEAVVAKAATIVLDTCQFERFLERCGL